MFYPWPGHHREGVMFEALDIAMNYLRRTGYSEPHIEELAANIIWETYRNGVRHRIALANRAIVAIERSSAEKFSASTSMTRQVSFYPQLT
jgi:hypothetical protein